MNIHIIEKKVKMINKRLFFILFFFLAGCSNNDLSHDEIVADPLMNEIPIVSIYNSNNEEMEARSFAICWNYCDEAILSPVNEEGRVQNSDTLNEAELGETMEIALHYESPHTVSHQLVTFDGSSSTEEELEDETFEVHGQGDIQYAIVTRFLNEHEETIGRIQTNFSVQLY
ncbi:hypothetical protein EH196_04710 [Bacillus sp. C1-1]|nr:hypothetical protein EH196_04710 [Bacillus sp. C1-1]